MKLNLETSGASGVDATCQQAGEEAGGGGSDMATDHQIPIPSLNLNDLSATAADLEAVMNVREGGQLEAEGGQLEPRQAQVIHMFYPLYFIPPL